MKMKEPYMEVIRFEAKDVIATSGLTMSALSGNGHYYTKKIEAVEYNSGYERSYSDWFVFDTDSNGSITLDGYLAGVDNESSAQQLYGETHYYAWFHNNGWLTYNLEYGAIDQASKPAGYDTQS